MTVADDLFCKRCDNLVMYPPCRCQPFKVKRLERGYEDEQPETVYALDPEFAAEKWAEEYDSDAGERRLLNGAAMAVEVTAPDGEATRYDLHGESVPTYYARKQRRSGDNGTDGR